MTKNHKRQSNISAQAFNKLKNGNTKGAVKIVANMSGSSIGTKGGLLAAGFIITASGVGAPAGICITVVAVGLGSFGLGWIFEQAAVEVYYYFMNPHTKGSGGGSW